MGLWEDQHGLMLRGIDVGEGGEPEDRHGLMLRGIDVGGGGEPEASCRRFSEDPTASGSCIL